jgi:hypothetical protein
MRIVSLKMVLIHLMGQLIWQYDHKCSWEMGLCTGCMENF